MVSERLIKNVRNYSMPCGDGKPFPTIWVFTSNTVPRFPCLRNSDGIFPLCSRLPGEWCHPQWRQKVSEDSPANARGILWPSKSCPFSCSTSPFSVSAQSIPFLGVILIIFGAEGRQNISKAKWRGKGSRLFKRDLPSTLETILFQNGFCCRVGNFCCFLGLVFSARQDWDSSSHTCFFFHSVVPSSYAVSLPLVTQQECLSWNSPSRKGCCNRAITSL